MKRHEALSVGQIIERAIASTGNRDEYERQQICYLWQQVVGQSINRQTIRRFVVRDEMHVYLASAALKSELSYHADRLVASLNALVGKQVIVRIVFH